jgi:uncharacterized membrane protein YsdA (DUF1294 family)/cold shock CspA family protein
MEMGCFGLPALFHLPRSTRLPGCAEAWELIRVVEQAKIKPEQETPVVKTGIISIWNEEKGFGWVEDGETRLFFHSREFPGIDLKEGGGLSYWVGTDIRGRPCARSPQFSASGRISGGSWLLLAALLAVPVMALTRVPVPWWWPLTQVIALSVATYRLYAFDKLQAVKGKWRVPETSLHLAELAGGWPGAFLAQRRLRHKCQKGRFKVFFWCIIVLHQVVGLDFFLKNYLSRELWQMMGQGSVFGG